MNWIDRLKPVSYQAPAVVINGIESFFYTTELPSGDCLMSLVRVPTNKAMINYDTIFVNGMPLTFRNN